MLAEADFEDVQALSGFFSGNQGLVVQKRCKKVEERVVASIAAKTFTPTSAAASRSEEQIVVCEEETSSSTSLGALRVQICSEYVVSI